MLFRTKPGVSLNTLFSSAHPHIWFSGHWPSQSKILTHLSCPRQTEFCGMQPLKSDDAACRTKRSGTLCRTIWHVVHDDTTRCMAKQRLPKRSPCPIESQKLTISSHDSLHFEQQSACFLMGNLHEKRPAGKRHCANVQPLRLPHVNRTNLLVPSLAGNHPRHR